MTLEQLRIFVAVADKQHVTQAARELNQWEIKLAPAEGNHAPMVRCTNPASDVQPVSRNWNNSGFMRSVIETVLIVAV